MFLLLINVVISCESFDNQSSRMLTTLPCRHLTFFIALCLFILDLPREPEAGGKKSSEVKPSKSKTQKPSNSGLVRM